LSELLCNQHNLEATVCHYPSAASKWNPIEHRLFSEISKNWRGPPRVSYETVLKYIRRTKTKTKTGLNVRAPLVTKGDKKGMNVSKDDFEAIAIKAHKTLPKWNDTIFTKLRNPSNAIC